MDLGLEGKVAMVTGASRGLGRECALALAREGCRLAICARGPEDLERTAGQLRALGAEVLAEPADVTKEEDARRFFESALARFGRVDILVNNVGGSRGRTLEDTPDDLFRYVMELNFWSAVRMTRLAVPGMKERKWGRIIHIASIWGREYGGGLAYMTAKSALISFSKHLALELAPHNVLVNCVAPGSILFPGGAWDRFVQSSPPEVVRDFIRHNLPMGRFGWPEPIGALVAFLASEQAGLITGACYNIDGGQSRSLI